jgi:hypothetical protein
MGKQDDRAFADKPSDAGPDSGKFGARPSSIGSGPKANLVTPPTNGPKGPAGNSGAAKK